MVSFQLAQIVFVLGLSTVTSAAAFLAWWFYDQRRDWVIAVDDGNVVDWWKADPPKEDTWDLDYNGEHVEVPIEPDKNCHKRGFRSGTARFVDLGRGVQVDPRALDLDHAVGYDVATVVDAKFGRTWRKNFPDEKPLHQFLASISDYAGLLIIGSLVLLGIFVWQSIGG